MRLGQGIAKCCVIDDVHGGAHELFGHLAHAFADDDRVHLAARALRQLLRGNRAKRVLRSSRRIVTAANNSETLRQIILKTTHEGCRHQIKARWGGNAGS